MKTLAAFGLTLVLTCSTGLCQVIQQPTTYKSNPYTGAVSVSGGSYNQLTGTSSHYQNTNNAFTGTHRSSVSTNNPYTGRTTNTRAAYNPWVGSARSRTVRRY